MPTEIKDYASISGVVVTFGLGVFNAWRARKIARTVDTLLLDDKRFGLLRAAIDTETLQIKTRTTVSNVRFRAKSKLSGLTAQGQIEVQRIIEESDKLVRECNESIQSSRTLQQTARSVLGATEPTFILLAKVNRLSGEMNGRHSQALNQQALTDDFVVASDNLLTIVK
jgi:hypothetical protein